MLVKVTNSIKDIQQSLKKCGENGILPAFTQPQMETFILDKLCVCDVLLSASACLRPLVGLPVLCAIVRLCASHKSRQVPTRLLL